jgi:DICT domain-containing protein
VLFGAFQRERFYRALEPRWRRMARHADAATVFADFAALRQPSGAPVEVPIAEGEALANEWAVIVDAPGYAACLLAWEQPGAIEPAAPEDLDRRFEAIWTIDPQATRRAAQAAARLAGNVDPAYGTRLEELLADRPLAMEQPAPALTALTNRMLAYVEGVR